MARTIMERHWEGRFTVPNPETYAAQWLWDSCFHTIIWAHLDDERAVIELESVFDEQQPSGFVPHMRYHQPTDDAAKFWGRLNTSSITQPPMFGHAYATLLQRGFRPSEELAASITTAFTHLLTTRKRSKNGLLCVVHPWETGCDDSARWDMFLPSPWTPSGWKKHKGELVTTIVRDNHGDPVWNPLFPVAPVSFNALVAWNMQQFAQGTNNDQLARQAQEITAALKSTWDQEHQIWSDQIVGPVTVGTQESSLCAPTVEAFLPLLLDETHHVAVLAQLRSETEFCGARGWAQTAKSSSRYDPTTYWRGGAWAPLNYLIARAVMPYDHMLAATQWARSGRAVQENNAAEYWHPETGVGGGATPQSWSVLPLAISAIV